MAQATEDVKSFWGQPLSTIGKSEGLTDFYIKDFLNDPYGRVWIASHNSLNVYDGNRLLNCSLDTLGENGMYTSLAYDKKRDHLWIGSLLALACLDVRTMQVEWVLGAGTDYENWSGGPIYKVYIDDNDQLIVGRNEGFTLINLEDKTYKSIIPKYENGNTIKNHIVYSILQDPEVREKYWMGTNFGLICYDNKTETCTSHYPDEEYCPSLGNVYHIDYIPENDEIIYSNISDGGVSNECNFLIIDRSTGTHVQKILLSPSWRSRGIFRNGNELMLSTDQGIGIYNIETRSVGPVFTNQNEDAPARIDFMDDNENLWSITTNGLQIYGLKTEAVSHHSYTPELTRGYHVCSDLLIDKDELFMAVYGSDGVYRFNLKSKKWRILKNAELASTTPMFAGTGIERLTDGTLLALSNQGIYKITDHELDKINIPDVVSFGEGVVDNEDQLWIHSKNAFCRISFDSNSKSWRNKPMVERYPDSSPQCEDQRRAFRPVLDNTGNPWFLGICEGFVTYNYQDKRFYTSEEMNIPPLMEGYITDVMVSDNTAYLISEYPAIGIIDLNKKPWKFEKIIDLYEKDGTEEYFKPTRAVLDNDGILWMISSKGLVRYDFDKDDLQFFNEDDGIIINDEELGVFTAEQMIPMDDSKLVYSTRKAIHIVNKNGLLNLEKEKPKAYVNALYINNEPFVSDSTFLFKRKYRLKSHQNYLTFEFSAIASDLSHDIQFAHRLIDIDDEWVESNRSNITYSHLKGGDYCLELKSRYGNGPWGPVYKSNIHINKKWHESNWTRFGAIFLLLSLIYGFYRYRLNQAIIKQRLKTDYEKNLAEVKMNALTAQMNPHFIFNSLNSIDYFIIKNDTRRASDYLNRFAKLIRLILNHSRSNYISLREDLEALQLYIEIESLRFDQKFDYVVEADKYLDLDAIQIPPMILQPYVENAIWHGLLHKSEKGCLRVKVRMDQSEQAILATIEDNGIGRERALEIKSKSARRKNQKGMGMTITRNKLELMNHLHNLNASVEIDDLTDENGSPTGTKVTLRIPI